MPPLPPAGAVTVATPADPAACAAFVMAGFRPLGAQMLRVDQVERLARVAHEARDGKGPFVPDPALATSLGLMPASFAQLMLALGFRAAEAGWVWKARRDRPAPSSAPHPRPGNAFGALVDLRLQIGASR